MQTMQIGLAGLGWAGWAGRMQGDCRLRQMIIRAGAGLGWAGLGQGLGIKMARESDWRKHDNQFLDENDSSVRISPFLILTFHLSIS